MRHRIPILLAATFLCAAPVFAQPASTPDLAAELAALRARVEALQARVDELESERAPAAPTGGLVTPVPAAETVATPAVVAEAQVPSPAPETPEIRFRGAPQISAPGGWSFKPRGRLQLDAAHVGRPAGIADPGLGFSNEIRRARLGVEGTIPGGFGYVFEIDLADTRVEITDAILSWRASESLGVTIGQHNPFQSLEELTSSRFISFVERAAFTDAFNFERRIGVSGVFSRGDLLVQGGVFTDNVEDLGDDANDAVSADARIVLAPRIGEARLHLGASAHWRDTGDVASAIRYRQRPLVHSTDVRFIATPVLNVGSETHFGLEAALIRGPLHAVAEAHWLDANRAGGAADPGLFGAYAEIGWFLTGETRGYRAGRWDRTNVRRPLGAEGGGFGALQFNLRYDRLDLNSAGALGGTQDSYQLGLVWIPSDYVRFLLNYARLVYGDAAIPAAGGNRDYAVDVVGARAQIDF